MYSEKIENLINLALADGELTDKEKQVLFKKAETEGIDLDEFEMVLDAKLHEVTKRKSEPPEAKPQSNKLGDMKKCPACGALIRAFQTVCNECGHEFRNVEANSSVAKLVAQLEKTNSISKQSKIITNFPVPNTREDLLEFFYFAYPKAQNNGYDDVTNAWGSKFQEVANRAKVSFSNDTKMLSEILEYEKKFERHKRNKILLIILLVIGTILLMILLDTI